MRINQILCLSIHLQKKCNEETWLVSKQLWTKYFNPIIQGKILSQSTVFTDAWRSYDSLILHGYDHYRIHHHENEFARGKNNINGIESFWSFTKARLLKMKGVRKDKFMLHLKESEFRWNYRKSMYQEILKRLRENPL